MLASEGSMKRSNLAIKPTSLQRGASDSTVTRKHKETGETLPVPGENPGADELHNRKHRETSEWREGVGRVHCSDESG